MSEYLNDFSKFFSKWLEDELNRREIKFQTFAREAKIPGEGRSFRSARAGNRRWTLNDICLIANYFDESPSIILAKAELFYKIHKNNR